MKFYNFLKMFFMLKNLESRFTLKGYSCLLNLDIIMINQMNNSF